MSSNIIKPVIFAVATVVSFSASVASAQESGRVAILDVAKVFKENKSFTTGPALIGSADVSGMRLQADQLKKQITAERNALKKELMELQDHPAGSTRDQKEAEIEQRQTRLRTSSWQSAAELINREARVYFDTYCEMQAVVEAVAKEFNISLVLRVDNQITDPNNRNEVIQNALGPPVVHHCQIDLTNVVSDRLNKRMAAPKAATATP